MEILKSVMTDYALFSLIDAYIFCLFFKKVGKCNNIKWYECMLLGLINSLVSLMGIPMVYQIFGIFYMGAFISLKKSQKIKDSLFISMSASIYMLIVEMMYTFLISVMFKIDVFTFENIERFLIIIPMRVIEIIILKRGERIIMKLKWWAGEVEKPEKEEVKTETK